MGTNYYLHRSDKPHCASCTCYERLHIGKSSAGWCFSLHVMPEAGINSLDDWRVQFSQLNTTIFSESGRLVDSGEMLDEITARRSGDDERLNNSNVPFGYTSWEQFHQDNDSEPGPHGLLRHKIGRHCAGHGDGTWDLIPGEFS